MRTWAHALVAVVVATGCNYGAEAFICTDDTSCGAGGTCETNGSCSLIDTTCPSGRRYTDHSGNLSGRCIGDEPIDGGTNGPDARVCFGTSLLNNFNVCLAAVPTTPLTISADMQLNTDNAQMCTPVASGGTGLCVVAATTISIDGTLRATGVRPLVLIATDSITVTANGAIDVASHRGANPEVGAGGSPPTCTPGVLPTFANSTNGGGAGGSFAGLGGKGGNGGGVGGSGGMPAAIVSPINELRGGCPGQDGLGSGQARGLQGHGGGAVLLIAANTIDHAGMINAAGEGGGAGQTNSAGGGGGGSGGMIVLDAQAITGSGVILANGGGGGEGSSTLTAGQNGADPSAITAASGGSGGSDNGGDGGAGSAGIAGGSGGNGANGVGGGSPGGGGGGGGGAGLIQASVGLGTNTNVSPTPTP